MENKLPYPTDLVNSILGTACLPEHFLSLNSNYIFMLLPISQAKNGHVNGTLYNDTLMSDKVLFTILKLGSIGQNDSFFL